MATQFEVDFLNAALGALVIRSREDKARYAEYRRTIPVAFQQIDSEAEDVRLRIVSEDAEGIRLIESVYLLTASHRAVFLGVLDQYGRYVKLSVFDFSLLLTAAGDSLKAESPLDRIQAAIHHLLSV